jgi:phage-related protein
MTALPLQSQISQASSKKHVYRTLKMQFGDGYEQTTSDGINDQFDSWQIQTLWLDPTDYATYKTFLDTVKNTEKFTWTAFNDSVEKNWKIDGDVSESYSANLTQISFTIKQTFDIT